MNKFGSLRQIQNVYRRLRVQDAFSKLRKYHVVLCRTDDISLLGKFRRLGYDPRRLVRTSLIISTDMLERAELSRDELTAMGFKCYITRA